MKHPSKLVIFQILEKNHFDTGSVHQMFQAASGLSERGHQVTIVSRPGSVLEERSRESGVAFAGISLRSELDLKSIRALHELVRAHRPDVIHVHKGLSHTLALAATWRDRVPAFVVNRGVSFPLTMWNRPKYRTGRVDRIVTVCEGIKRVIVESGRLAEGKVEVVYAGVDLHDFDPDRWSREEFRREKEISSDSFLVAQVGVRDWKGWRELIEAFSDLAREVPHAHLALIACKSPEQIAEVRKFAAECGVADRVTPVEYRSDMARVLMAADVVVDASWAGTGVTGTIREAMALGKPVIATDCGGNSELVSSRDVGWLVPPRDRARLSRALLEIAGDRDSAVATGGRAREHVKHGFSRELRIDRLEKLYGEIIKAKTSK